MMEMIKILRIKRKLIKLHLLSIKLMRFFNSVKMKTLGREPLMLDQTQLEVRGLLVEGLSSMEKLVKEDNKLLDMEIVMLEELNLKKLRNRCSSSELKIKRLIVGFSKNSFCTIKMWIYEGFFWKKNSLKNTK